MASSSPATAPSDQSSLALGSRTALTHWPLGSGAHPAQLALSVPVSAHALTAPPLDLGAAPGAHVAVLARWGLGEGAEAEIGCVLGPTDRWVDGLQDAVLSAASSVARARGGWSTLAPGAVSHDGSQLTQPFTAVASGPERPVLGRHLLAFAGDAPELLVCTVACAPANATSDECSQLVGSMVVTGTTEPPRPGLAARAVGWVARDATTALGLAALLCATGLLLALRWRPRPRG